MVDSYKTHPTWARGYGVWLTVNFSTLIMLYMKIKIKIAISTDGARCYMGKLIVIVITNSNI
jgi:hypothetical protein